MQTRHLLRGIDLRYALTMYLLQHGPTTVDELLEALEWQGFDFPGRASKQVSDALRWERGRGRVRRTARGLYGPGYVPRGTEHRIYTRMMVCAPRRNPCTSAVSGYELELSLSTWALSYMPPRQHGTTGPAV
ncbi:hypothetical protein J3E61_004192 [Mycobacterium sp. OAE908]